MILNYKQCRTFAQTHSHTHRPNHVTTNSAAHCMCESNLSVRGDFFRHPPIELVVFRDPPPTLMFLLPRTFYMVFHVVFTPPPPSSATPQCSEVLRRNEIFHRWGEFYIFAFFSRANFPNEDDDDANDDEDVLLWKNFAICCLLQRGCRHRRFFVCQMLCTTAAPFRQNKFARSPGLISRPPR